jgi:hypothetical protein
LELNLDVRLVLEVWVVLEFRLYGDGLVMDVGVLGVKDWC